MTEVATQETKPVKVPRVKLELKFVDTTYPLAKFPFPVKAARFPVTINGEPAEAASTTGRGKSYTYILYKNTSFYIAATLPSGAEVSVNFPEGYKFDEVQAPRVSNYKPKRKPKDAAPATDEAQPPSDGAVDPQPVEVPAAEAPKASRRGR